MVGNSQEFPVRIYRENSHLYSQEFQKPFCKGLVRAQRSSVQFVSSLFALFAVLFTEVFSGQNNFQSTLLVPSTSAPINLFLFIWFVVLLFKARSLAGLLQFHVLQTRKSLHSKVIFSEELYYTVYQLSTLKIPSTHTGLHGSLTYIFFEVIVTAKLDTNRSQQATDW